MTAAEVTKDSTRPGPGLLRPALAGGLAALALFLALTPPVLGIGDPAEFTLVLAACGVPHPTGYPLYVLLGSPFVRGLHALGVEWVRAAAAWSALGGAVAAALMVGAGGRMTARAGEARGLAFVVPALLVVLHPVMLEAATEAEVHTWWYAWCAGALLFALGRLRALEDARGAGHAGRWAFAWGALCGAGLAHHAASLLILLPLTVALAIGAARAGALRPPQVAAGVLGALLTLASYGFVAWRAFHPAAFQWPLEPTAASVISHVRGAAYAFYVGGWAPDAAQRALLRTAVFPLLAPGLLGVAWLALRTKGAALRAWWTAMLAAAVLLVAFIVNYGVPDPARYFLPALMIAALAAGQGFGALERRMSRPPALALLAAVVLGAGAWSVRLTLDENRRRALADARIRAAWLAIPFERAIVMWWDDHVNRLKIYQLLGSERPGLYVENPNRLTWPGPRRAFHQRFGFDPFEGFELRERSDVGRLTDHLRGRAPLPVMDFPEVLEIGSEPDSAGRGRTP